MYNGGSVGLSAYTEAKDFLVAVYLEDPSYVAKSRNRTYYNEAVQNGGSFTHTWSNVRTKEVCGMVFHTCPSGTPSGSVRVVMTSITYGTLVDKSIPYSATFGISMAELPMAMVSNPTRLGTFTITIYNNTGVQIHVCYITNAPLLAIGSTNGLKSVSCGESMGNDEYLPEFGVSHMYGSFEFQDTRRVVLSMLTNPTSYGLDADLFRYSLRCEVFVGTQLAAVESVDEFSFSEDNKRVKATLKSVLLALDSIPGLGPRVAYMGQLRLLGDALTEYFAYTKSNYPDVLAQFDFGGLCNGSIPRNYVLEGPLAVTQDTTVLGFLEKVGQAIGCIIGIRHVLTTSMQYGLSVYSGTSLVGDVEQNLGAFQIANSKIDPKDIIGEVEYTPIRKNYIDKITYSKYDISISENVKELSVDYELVDMTGYNDPLADKQAFLTYWSQKSLTANLPQNNPLETTYGMRIPRPSDVSYDSSSSKYVVNYSELEKSEVRALTRGFLWRFKFATSFRNSKFSSTTVGNVVSTMESKAVYGGDGAFSNQYMMGPVGNSYSPYSGRQFSYYDWNSNEQSVRVTLSSVSKTFSVQRIFNYMPSLYTLHVKIPSGYYLVDGQYYSVNQYFSYWFSPVYGFNPWRKKEDWESEDRSWTPLPNDGQSAYWSNRDVMEWEPDMERISDYMTLKATANQFTAYSVGHPNGVYQRDIKAVFNTYNYGDPYVSGDVMMVGMCNDIDGGYGAPDGCFNLNDSEHSGENTIWPAHDPVGLGYGVHWFHSGFEGDATARGNAIDIVVSSVVSVETILGHNNEQDEHGNLYVQWQLPSASVLTDAIKGSDDNFLSKVQKQNADWTGDEDQTPGERFVQQCNPYCTFWSVPGVGSIKDRTEMIYRAENVSSDLTWRTPRPSYGFCVKSVRYAISGRFLEIAQGETFTIRYNKQNQYNYDLATNELVRDGLTMESGGVEYTALDWLLSDISTSYQSGKTVYWVKSKIRGIRKQSSSSLAPFVRNPYLNDRIYELNASRSGSATNMLAATWANVKSIEYVMENGECYVNLRLMDA